MDRDYSDYDLLAWLWCPLPDGRFRTEVICEVLGNPAHGDLVARCWCYPGLLDGCPVEPKELLEAMDAARLATGQLVGAERHEAAQLIEHVWRHFAEKETPAAAS